MDWEGATLPITGNDGGRTYRIGIRLVLVHVVIHHGLEPAIGYGRDTKVRVRVCLVANDNVGGVGDDNGHRNLCQRHVREHH